MNLDEQKQIAVEMLRACDVGDAAAIATLISDDFKYELMDRTASWTMNGQEMKGSMDRKTFLEMGVPASAALFQDGLHFTIDLVMSEGANVAVFGESNATVGDGRKYNNLYCWFFTFSGDRISLYREYCDTYLSRKTLFD